MRKGERTPVNHSVAIDAAIADIASMAPNHPTGQRGHFERRFMHWSWYFMTASLLALLAVLAVALAYQVGLPKDFAHFSAIVLSMSVQITALIGLIFNTLSMLAAIISWHRNEAQLRQEEFLYDAAYAKQLERYPSEVLEQADQWFESRAKRFERRQMLWFGGLPQLSFVALIAAGWAVSKEALPLWDSSSSSHWAIVLVAAFVTGAALGGLMTVGAGGRIAYQREVVRLALSQRVFGK
jgi:hypothetical protein